MKIKIRDLKWQEEEIEIPDKYSFIWEKPYKEWTDEDYNLNIEYVNYIYDTCECEDFESIGIIKEK